MTGNWNLSGLRGQGPGSGPNIVRQAIGLFVALAGPPVLARLASHAVASLARVDLRSPWALLLYTGSQVVGLAVLWRLEGFDALYHGRLGLRGALLALGFWVIAFFLWYPTSLIFRALGLPTSSTWGWWTREGAWFVPVGIWAVGAAFFEEGFYRGYAIPRLAAVLRSNAAALFASSAFFGLIHLRFGSFLATYTFLFGLVAGLLYLRTRSTWACVTYHLVNNLVVDFVIYGTLGRPPA